ncbi:hypothetical protein BD310DRAFT_341707 [Dichomitus squalens]|uniref:Uncharacterized protein n=1 Tax=Dichomitus squalens TaxID=114155 RepID=A0A4Q9Q025_9APHY|nr:hypothetical protein BD310DRAFT_341707 [Dichomitus squalens]
MGGVLCTVSSRQLDGVRAGSHSKHRLVCRSLSTALNRTSEYPIYTVSQSGQHHDGGMRQLPRPQCPYRTKGCLQCRSSPDSTSHMTTTRPNSFAHPRNAKTARVPMTVRPKRAHSQSMMIVKPEYVFRRVVSPTRLIKALDASYTGGSLVLHPARCT